jgi:hypothetical protein
MKLFEILKPEEVKTNIRYNNKLNPKVWDGDSLREDVKKALKRIAKEFLEFLEINPKSVEDIIITGSNCGYNYTKQSDIDLHLVINLAKIHVKCEDFIGMYFQAKKAIWNDSHEITIHGFPVELYAQDAKEQHISAGEYSLQDDKWLSKPKKEKPSYNSMSVKGKAADIMNQIDSMIDNKETDLHNIQKLKDKIKTMRKSGLQTAGEWSVENLAFKTLRNNGYLERLSNYKSKLEDDDLSI